MTLYVLELCELDEQDNIKLLTKCINFELKTVEKW